MSNEDFHDKSNECITTTQHFFCSCPYEHEYKHFILACENHTFIENVSVINSCNCKKIGNDEVYSFCVQIKYTTNCHGQKIYVEKIPEYLKSKLLSLDVFLEGRLFSCEPFFIFLGSNNKVNIYIDNPLEEYMHSKETD